MNHASGTEQVSEPGTLRNTLWVASVALMVSLAGLGNDFAQDDLYLIRDNARIHDLWNWKEIVTSPYWPAPLSQDLYRPVLSLLHSFEFVMGGGSPVLFRLVSYVLYALLAVGVFRLARRMLPVGVAAGLALIFAAHPVHTEAVALASGQGELIVGLVGIEMAIFYADRRQAGGLRPRHWAWLAVLYAAACLVKEQGFVLPMLLLAFELCFFSKPVRESMRRPWRGYAGLVALGVLLLLLRRSVLGGNIAGTFTAEALQGLGMAGRALTMLQVVPQWARLLTWPAHLRLDYSPQEMIAAARMGTQEWLGVVMLAGSLAVAWIARRRAPVVTFGLTWCAIALLPVSNVLIPTGILVAERTLLLPSVGFLVAIGGMVAFYLPQPIDRSSRSWHSLQTACIVVVLTGALRSAERQLVWRNDALLSVRSVQDAPRSFRTQRAYGDLLFQLHEDSLAEAAYRRALAYAPRGSAWRVRNDLARQYRSLENRGAEANQLILSLAEEPSQDDARGYLVAAELALGRYAQAATDADAAMRRGGNAAVFGALREMADSAGRVGAAPGSVRIRVKTAGLAPSR